MKRSIHKSIFKKKLMVLLIPILIPMLILGTLSIMITLTYVKEEINKNNMNLLQQTKQNLELILNELDSLRLNFDTNPRIAIDVKKVLRSQRLTLEEYRLLSSIGDYIKAPANARPYIHSIYVYFNNEKGQFLTTEDNVVQLSNYYDSSWYDRYINQKKEVMTWTELRQVKKYDFDKDTKVITIYRRLNSNNGVIILNILPQYLETSLEKLVMFDSQSILILNENNQIIFNNHSLDYINNLDLNSLIRSNHSFFSLHTDKRDYAIFQISSERYGWRYFSIIPQTTLYHIPIKLIQITVFLLFISLILGLILTYYLTKKDYNLIQNMLTIIESAQEGHTLPSLPNKVTDEYEYITYNILKTFIEQSYLKVQLSERKYKLKTMELLALQSQLNPHFLYNTLETIYWKTLSFTGKPNEANTMLEHLSDILKYSLSNPSETVTLEEEIIHTKNYIAILKMRYKEKFEVIWEFDESCTNFKILKLILQPLIENCIYHGIKEKSGQGLIKIKIYLRNQLLNIVIIDNGLGMAKDKLLEIKDRLAHDDTEVSEHIGLFNTNKRIRLTYGNDNGIDINSKYGWGTIIKMFIPYE